MTAVREATETHLRATGLVRETAYGVRRGERNAIRI